MLSVIHWINRDTFDNHFDDAFGYVNGTTINPLVDQAKNVIDVAIADWERVITSFNYLDPNQTYNVNISMSDSPKSSVAGHTFIDQSGLVPGIKGLTPSSATFVIDWKSWLNPDGTLPSGSPQNIAAG